MQIYKFTQQHSRLPHLGYGLRMIIDRIGQFSVIVKDKPPPLPPRPNLVSKVTSRELVAPLRLLQAGERQWRMIMKSRKGKLSTFQQLERLRLFKFQLKMKLKMVRCVDKDKVKVRRETVEIMFSVADTTSRGKLVVSFLVVVGVALLSYLMFSVLEVRRTEPGLSGAEEEYDYGYFRIKEWP